MVAKTTVAPLDRLKILLQGQNSVYKQVGKVHFLDFCPKARDERFRLRKWLSFPGIASGITKIVSKEGFLSLFQGNGAQMVRIFPYSAIQFTSFEFYKRVVPILFRVDERTHQATKFIAGSMAGVTAVIFTFPLDLIRSVALEISCVRISAMVFPPGPVWLFKQRIKLCTGASYMLESLSV